MKISCDIIRDLLPLYAENMTSAASNEMVEAHLGECEGCSQCLDDLRAPVKRPEQIPIENLEHIKNAISKRRILTVLTAVFLIVSIFVGAYTVLNTYVYLTADQAVERVEQLEDGTVCIHWTDQVDNYGMAQIGDNLGFACRAQVKKLLFAEQRDDRNFTATVPSEHGIRENIDPANTNIWYYTHRDGRPEKLLWDAGAEMPGEDFTFEERICYTPAYYLAGSAILAFVFLALAWRKRGTRAAKILRYGALYFGCSAVATLLITCGQFEEVSFSLSVMIESKKPFAPMFATGYFAFELWDLNHPAPAREFSQGKLARDRKAWTVLTAVLLIFSLCMGAYTFLNVATLYLTADEAVLSVEEQEDGNIHITYSELANSHYGFGRDDWNGKLCSGTAGAVLAYRLGYKQLDSDQPTGWSDFPKDNADTWYLNPKDATADKLLWGEGSNRPEKAFSSKNYALAWYCFWTGLGCGLMLVLTRYIPDCAKYLRYGAVICGSLCIAGLFMSGGEFYTYLWSSSDLKYTISNSMVTAVPLMLAGFCGCKIYELKK